MKAEGRHNLRCDKGAGSICPPTHDNRFRPLRELRGEFARPSSLPAILSVVAVAAKSEAASATEGQTVVNSVKSSQTGAVGQTAGQIVCKYLKMNGLQNNWRSVRSNPVKVNQTDMMSFFKVGAGEGNRTLMASLEGWHSAIELRPRHFPFIIMAALALSIRLRISSPQ